MGEPKPTRRSRTLADSSYRHLEERLSAKTTIRVSDTPLSELIEEISNAHQIPIFPQRRVLRKANVDLDSPVTIDVHSIRLRVALNLILSKHDLAYIMKNEVIQYTTKDEALRQSLVQRYVLPVSRPAPQTSLVESLRRVLAESHQDPMPQPAVEIRNARDGDDRSKVLVVTGNAEMHARVRDHLSRLLPAE